MLLWRKRLHGTKKSRKVAHSSQLWFLNERHRTAMQRVEGRISKMCPYMKNFTQSIGRGSRCWNKSGWSSRLRRRKCNDSLCHNTAAWIPSIRQCNIVAVQDQFTATKKVSQIRCHLLKGCIDYTKRMKNARLSLLIESYLYQFDTVWKPQNQNRNKEQHLVRG